MTLHIADIASYQGNLTVAQLRAAGFGGVNLKISHGLGLKSVHPKIERYTDFAVGTFHWLTQDASGTAQAEHAYARMRALGLTNVAHTVDVESDGLTERIYRDYLIRMTWLLQRSILTYSGKWWANSRFWLRSSAESPWLWSAPGKGYVSAYPGDSSPMWDDGYAGWDTLAVMQYRVAPVAKIDVSQSAVRDMALWKEMVGVRMNPKTHPRGRAPDFTLPKQNPNPERMTDALWWLVCMREALEPSLSENGGT